MQTLHANLNKQTIIGVNTAAIDLIVQLQAHQ